jgi:PAS domain-containing protein
VVNRLTLLTSDSSKKKELSDLVIVACRDFYLQDHTGKYLRWNHNFEKATGYDGTEIENCIPLRFDPSDHDK